MNSLVLSNRDIYNGNLILVNSRYPLVSQCHQEPFSLMPVNPQYPDILMERAAATVLAHVMSELEGVEEIFPVSGYRSLDEQRRLYKNSLRDNGAAFTEKYVALPNHSEHQTGLAIDLALGKEEFDFIRPRFTYEGICGEFRKRAPRYGFVERYQSDKESITGIAHEPWHFRYVGYPHSEIMIQNNLSLEEYIEVIKNYTCDGTHLEIVKKDHTIEVFYMPASPSSQTSIKLQDYTLYQSSGNNIDGFIITLWKPGAVESVMNRTQSKLSIVV